MIVFSRLKPPPPKLLPLIALLKFPVQIPPKSPSTRNYHSYYDTVADFEKVVSAGISQILHTLEAISHNPFSLLLPVELTSPR